MQERDGSGATQSHRTPHCIVPEEKYDEFLAQATDPDDANYWDVVVDLPRTQKVQMEAVDNAYSLYELVNGAVGACHVGRFFTLCCPVAAAVVCRSLGRKAI